MSGRPEERTIGRTTLGNPVLHRLDLPVGIRMTQLQGAADPGGVPDDVAAALLVVEDEQGKTAGETADPIGQALFARTTRSTSQSRTWSSESRWSIDLR